jgi:DNA-binding response OmpR family regulator
VARIVVVEDEAELAAAVAARLRSDGHLVSLAGDGPGAVELIAAERPDVVILDLMLPGFDGLEVCRRIQRDHPVPVIMLTASEPTASQGPGFNLSAAAAADAVRKVCRSARRG